MNKNIALSLASIMAALSVMGGATFAYFSSQATSTGNIFAAGTLVLQVDDEDEEPAATVSASLGGENMAPGSSTSGFISLHNSGTIALEEVLLGANRTANNHGGDGSELDSVLDMTVLTGDDDTCTTGATDHTAAITLQIGDNVSPLTLKELNTTDYNALPGVSVGATKYLCMTFTMQTTAGNEYQGDSITEDFILTGHQNAAAQ